MTERPILFQGPMVRAYRREIDPKTQTRRTRGLEKINEEPDAWECDGGEFDPLGWRFNPVGGGDGLLIRCPYGVAGDQLWCREAWKKREDGLAEVWYRADGHIDIPGWPWRSSIHMPRWASRDTLEVVSARPERLHVITEADITAEGICEQLVRSVVSPIALHANAQPEYWIGGYDQGFSFCRQCAEKKVRELKKKNPNGEFFVDGGWSTEGDSQAFCETCGMVLDNSFTTFGCEQELDHFAGHEWSLSPLDCLSLGNILGSYGWSDDEHRDSADLMAPQIHRLGFQAVWDSINGKKLPWSKNPWVWRIEFRRVKP